MNKYRRDSRSKEEFAQDIERCSQFERVLMQLYVDYLNELGKDEYTFEDNGVDNSGKLIECDRKITLDSDFVLYKNGKKPRHIEIKHSRPDCYTFHLKVPHIEHCIKNDVCIVMWMGTDTDKRRFCILTPKDLQSQLDNGERKMMWSKPCVRMKSSQIKWIYM